MLFRSYFDDDLLRVGSDFSIHQLNLGLAFELRIGMFDVNDFPHPEGPTMQTNSFSFTERLTSRRAATSLPWSDAKRLRLRGLVCRWRELF